MSVKKTLSIRIAFKMLIAILFVFKTIMIHENVFSANNLAYGDYEYIENNNGISIIAYSGSDETVVIPSEINGKKVTCINRFVSDDATTVIIPHTVSTIKGYAFQGCSALEAVIMKDNPDEAFEVSIGEYAFGGCKKIKTVFLSKNVSFLGSYAFGHTSIESIVIPKSVKNTAGPFEDCESLTTVRFADGITCIPKCICYESGENSHLKNVFIPDSVTEIGSSAFYGCKELETIDIPDSVVKIGSSAFGGCKSLKEIKLPHLLTNIDSNAFNGCSSLTEVEIPASVKEIGSGTFFQCAGLKKIIIPDGVTTLPYRVFYGCALLNEIDLPDSVTIIGQSAFSNCSALEEVYIPASVEKIEQDAFSRCTSLKSFTMEDNHDESFEVHVGANVFMGDSQLSSVHLSGNVTFIGANAFTSTAVKSIIIPKSLKNGGFALNWDGPFSGCTSLEEIIFEEGITRIPGYFCSFANRNMLGESHLERVVIPDTVTEIGPAAFYYCDKLKSITIPKSVTSIGVNAFGMNDKLTIYCVQDSCAEVYAEDNDFTYVQINDGDDISKEYFKIGIDTNQFIHHELPYKIDNEAILKKLIDNVSGFDELVRISENYDKKNGLCHGIAVSMCYGNQGMLDFNNITPGAYNYWGLGDPVLNKNLRDVIVYCSLLQLTTPGKPTMVLDKNDSIWFSLPLETRKIAFFTALTAEAKRSEMQKKPFVFAFCINNNGKAVGHSVVVCGYKWNARLKKHEIKIFDENENAYNRRGEYYTLYIDQELKSFEFSDANARNGGYTIQDRWLKLSYYGIDTLYRKNSALDGKYFAASTADGTMPIQITANKKFKLENEKGEWLEYDGTNYTGNMSVYDCYTDGLDGSMMWNITIDRTDSLKLTKAENSCRLIATINGQGYALTADGADSVLLSVNGVLADGKEYDLNAYVQSDNNKIIGLQTKAKGNTTIQKKAEQIILKSDTGCKNTAVYKFEDLKKEEIKPESVTSKNVVIDTEESIKFTDVKKGKWFYDYIKYVYKRNIMTGLNATTFGPDDQITRAMVVTVLWRMAGEPEPESKGKVFPDVPTGKWYSKPIAWAKENKIVGGYETGLFGTNDSIIRQDFVKILKGYNDYVGAAVAPATKDSYTVKADAKDVSKYAIESMQWAFQRSLIGQGSDLNPKGFLTRAETAAMIMRFEDRLGLSVK